MKIFWKKYKILVLFFGYLLFLGAFIYGVIFTLIKNIKQNVDSVQSNILDDQIDKKKLSQVPELEKSYATFSSGEEKLAVILPPEKEVDFIKSLEGLAEETGNEISLRLIKDDEEKASKDKIGGVVESNEKKLKTELPHGNYINIQLELKGEYLELINFMQKVENFGYYINVLSLDLKKEKVSEEKKLVRNLPEPQLPAENPAEENKKKEFLRSLIELIVYIKE
jgi:hypothetical protein